MRRMSIEAARFSGPTPFRCGAELRSTRSDHASIGREFRVYYVK